MHDLLLGAPGAKLGTLTRAGVVFVVTTEFDILPTIHHFDAFTGDDLGSTAAAYDALGSVSLQPRHDKGCDGGGDLGSITL